MADDVIAALAKLKPAAPDRDAILFAAGRASARRGPWRLLLSGLVVQQAILMGLWLTPKPPADAVDSKADAVERPAPLDSQPSPPETPSPAPHGPASILNIDPPSSEPIPIASILPEEHWTARTALPDL